MKSDIHAGGTDSLQGSEQVTGRDPMAGIYFVVRGEVLIDTVQLEKAEPHGVRFNSEVTTIIMNHYVPKIRHGTCL